MAAVGFDLGSQNAVLAATKGRGVETLLNEFSSRLNPAFVYLEDVRVIGEGAKPQSITRSNNCVGQFKRLIGSKYDEAHSQYELKKAYFKHSKLEDGSIGIHLQYQGIEQVFTPEQVMAMYLTKMKQISEKECQRNVGTLVTSCPVWFTDQQRIALAESCQYSGLNLARIMNDTTATALAYSIYKNDLPEEDPRYVVFVDVGNSSTQTCVAAIIKGKLKIIGTAYDAYIGGRDFDERIADHMAEEFKSKHNIDLKETPRSYLRLKSECEKLKKLMSANAQAVPINIECLHGDFDFRSKMKREEFENMSSDLFERISTVLQKTKAIVDNKTIHSVEICGGSSRIPAIKKLVTETFDMPVNTTLNADECTAKGCAWQAAFHSPVHRPREFVSVDLINYSIDLEWSSTDAEGKIIPCRKTVFNDQSQVPSTKMLTFHRSQPFELTARYTNAKDNMSNQDLIGKYVLPTVGPNSKGEDSTIKVKLRVNPSGIFSVQEAHTVEEIMVPVEKMDVEKVENEQDAENEEGGKKKATAATEEQPEFTKKIIKHTVKVESLCNISEDKRAAFIQKEADMTQADANEHARTDAKNSVEEYVYELRDKLDGECREFADPSKVDEIMEQLDEIENWLYEDGESASKSAYVSKITELKAHGEPMQFRAREAEFRSSCVEKLRACIAINRNAYRLFTEGDEKYSHIVKEEMDKVEGLCKEAEDWLTESLSKLNAQPKFETPTVLCEDIEKSLVKLQKGCTPILNTPKPAPAAPPVDDNNNANANTTTEQQNSTTEEPTSDPQPKKDDMDVD